MPIQCINPYTYACNLCMLYVSVIFLCKHMGVTNSRAEPQQTPSVEKHAHPPRVVYCVYTQHLLDSQSFEFEICILQALNMLLIRCTNVSFQVRLSRHLLTGVTGPRRHPSLNDFYRRFLMGILPLFLGLSCSRRP